MKAININTIGCNALTRADKKINATLAENLATDILAVKAFFLTTQRTAWHSTTTNRYNSTTSTFLNEEEAKNSAENIRKRGSSFTIDELPAIVVKFPKSYILIAQINTNTPFKEYSLNSLRLCWGQVRRKQYGYLGSYLHVGFDIIEILQSFCWNSNFWRKNQPQESSVLTFLSSSKLESFCLLKKKENLKINKSFPLGTGYKLGWAEEKNESGKIKSRFVYKLVEQSKKSNITYTKPEEKLGERQQRSNLLKLNLKKDNKYGQKNKLVHLCTLALAIEYYTRVDSRTEAAEELKYCLRVIENNNTVYVTENAFGLIHKEMDARKAVKTLLLPGYNYSDN